MWASSAPRPGRWSPRSRRRSSPAAPSWPSRCRCGWARSRSSWRRPGGGSPTPTPALVVVDPDLAPFLDPPGGPPATRPWCCSTRSSPRARSSAPSGWQRPADDPERLAILQFTSGSTAAPKGVMLPDRCVGANIDAIVEGAAIQPRRPRGVVAAALPRHGPHRPARDARCSTASSSCSRAPQDFLAAPVRWLEWISEFRGTDHRGSELLLRARRPGAAPRRRARPARAGASRSTAPSRSTRTRSRRSAPRPPRSGFDARGRVPGVRHGRGDARRARSPRPVRA